MGCTACTEPQCLYKGALYLYLYHQQSLNISFQSAYLRLQRKEETTNQMCVNLRLPPPPPIF